MKFSFFFFFFLSTNNAHKLVENREWVVVVGGIFLLERRGRDIT